jgi:hypothetical protein
MIPSVADGSPAVEGRWVSLVRQVSVRQQAGSQAAAMNKTMVKNYGAQEFL